MTKRRMIYAKFEGFEEQLAHCYFLLHERFIANPPLAKFWVETDHVEQLLDTVKGIASDPEVSVDEAFYASLLVESSEMEEVYEKLIGALAKDQRILFDAIHASLRSHHAKFADAAEEFCDDRGFAQAFRNLGRTVS